MVASTDRSGRAPRGRSASNATSTDTVPFCAAGSTRETWPFTTPLRVSTSASRPSARSRAWVSGTRTTAFRRSSPATRASSWPGFTHCPGWSERDWSTPFCPERTVIEATRSCWKREIARRRSTSDCRSTSCALSDSVNSARRCFSLSCRSRASSRLSRARSMSMDDVSPSEDSRSATLSARSASLAARRASASEDSAASRCPSSEERRLARSASASFTCRSASSGGCTSDCCLRQHGALFAPRAGAYERSRCAGGEGRDHAQVLGHQRSVAAHLPQHLALLHGVDPQRRPLDGRCSRPQPGEAHRGHHQQQRDGDDPRRSVHLRLLARDIHGIRSARVRPAR